MELLLRLYTETLLEIGKERFEQAFHQVLKTSTFRPDIAEIRKAAGVNHGIVDPLEVEGMAELSKVIAAIRSHGRELKAKRGALINEGRGPDGVYLPAKEMKYEPETPAPVFSQATEVALIAIGNGDRQSALDVLYTHPTLWRRFDLELKPEFHAKNVQWFERQWMAAYKRSI